MPDREFISRRPHLSNESSRSGTKARRHIHPWVAIPENKQVGVTSPTAFEIRYLPAKHIAPMGRSCKCLDAPAHPGPRSEERRVGKECVSTWRSRVSA